MAEGRAWTRDAGRVPDRLLFTTYLCPAKHVQVRARQATLVGKSSGTTASNGTIPLHYAHRARCFRKSNRFTLSLVHVLYTRTRRRQKAWARGQKAKGTTSVEAFHREQSAYFAGIHRETKAFLDDVFACLFACFPCLFCLPWLRGARLRNAHNRNGKKELRLPKLHCVTFGKLLAGVSRLLPCSAKQMGQGPQLGLYASQLAGGASGTTTALREYGAQEWRARQVARRFAATKERTIRRERKETLRKRLFALASSSCVLVCAFACLCKRRKGNIEDALVRAMYRGCVCSRKPKPSTGPRPDHPIVSQCRLVIPSIFGATVWRPRCSLTVSRGC